MPSEAILAGSYDYRLVALSLLIATIASYTALDLGARVTAAQGRMRFVWLTGGGAAMGTGIWCKHYIGMLAYSLPIHIVYDWPTVLWSLFGRCGSIGSSAVCGEQKYDGAAVYRHRRITDGNRHCRDALYRHASHAAAGNVPLFSGNRVPVGRSRGSDFTCGAVVDVPFAGRRSMLGLAKAGQHRAYGSGYSRNALHRYAVLALHFIGPLEAMSSLAVRIA
jgi:hypothetical protein